MVATTWADYYVYRENEGVDSGTLQLKIDEAILKEQPSINRFIGFIKIISMVAPLLRITRHCYWYDRDLPAIRSLEQAILRRWRAVFRT